MGWTSTVFPALQAGNVIINQLGEFVYNPIIGAGNLVETIGIGTAGTDRFGNQYLQGDTTYNEFTGFAVQSFNGAINFYAGSLALGWTLTGSVLGGPTPAANHGITISNTNALIFSTYTAWVFPSGDTTGGVDLANINSALSTGLNVFLLDGLYYVNAPIQLPNYAIIQGMGRPALGKSGMTIIRATAAMPSVMASTSYIANTVGGNIAPNIRDLQIDCNSLASNGVILMSFDSVVNNISVENSLFDCIHFSATTHNGTVGLTADTPNNRIESCSLHNFGQYGVSSSDGANTVFTDGFLINCIIADSTGHGSGSKAVNLAHSAGWLISGNHFYGINGSVITAGVPSALRIVDNYFESWGQDTVTANTYYAVDFTTVPVSGNSGAIVARNQFVQLAAPGNAGSSIVGIGLFTPTGQTDYFSVLDNELTFTPAAGFVAANGIVWANGAATSTTNGVTTGNQIHGTWTNNVLQQPAGGVINLTAGV